MSNDLLSLPFLLLFTPLIQAAVTAGIVYVTTDAQSTCNTAGQNLTLIPDTCVSAPTSQTSVDPNDWDPEAFHELEVGQFAICSNGTTSNLILYSDKNCQTVSGIYQGSTTLGSGLSLAGTCLGLLAFDSVAFVCEGGPVQAGPTTKPATLVAITGPTTLSFGGSITSSATYMVAEPSYVTASVGLAGNSSGWVVPSLFKPLTSLTTSSRSANISTIAASGMVPTTIAYSSSELSKGDKAAIGVAIPIAIAGILVYWWF